MAKLCVFRNRERCNCKWVTERSVVRRAQKDQSNLNTHSMKPCIQHKRMKVEDWKVIVLWTMSYVNCGFPSSGKKWLSLTQRNPTTYPAPPTPLPPPSCLTTTMTTTTIHTRLHDTSLRFFGGHLLLSSVLLREFDTGLKVWKIYQRAGFKWFRFVCERGGNQIFFSNSHMRLGKPDGLEHKTKYLLGK